MDQRKIALVAVILLSAVVVGALLADVGRRAATVLDRDYGDYIYIEAAAAGSVVNMKVYNPAAFVEATIQTNLPDDYGLYVYYRFDWADNTGVPHKQEGVNYYANGTAGFTVRINATKLTSPVRFIAAEGRAGFGGDFDTRLVSASSMALENKARAQEQHPEPVLNG